MLDLLEIFPIYLIFPIVFLLLLPTLFTLLIRVRLYQFLTRMSHQVQQVSYNLGNDRNIGVHIINDYIEGLPAIGKSLVTKYETASKRLEEVNTVALVDITYSQTQFPFLWYSIYCEKWDYFSKILPNLLLSFGLLGTFLGITINLSEISTAVSNFNANDVNDLSTTLENLKRPLQGMGIAFMTSLVAISCSSILTIANSRWNTSWAKDQLINSLEDFLDNILQPKIEGNRRLDQAIDRMVRQQNDFLNRFHEKVTQAIENSLKKAATQLVEANVESHDLAQKVYISFSRAAGTLSQGASSFQETASTFKGQINKFEDQITKLESTGGELAQRFSLSTEQLHTTSHLLTNAASIIKESNFADGLQDATQNLSTTQNAFAQTTSLFTSHIEQFIQYHERVSDVADRIYNGFQESSTRFEESVQHFQVVASTIQEGDFARVFAETTQQLNETRNKFSTDMASLSTSISSLSEFMQNLQSILTGLEDSSNNLKYLAQQAKGLNQSSSKQIELVEQQLQTSQQHFTGMKSQIGSLVESTSSLQKEFNQSTQTLNNQLEAQVKENLSSSSEQLSCLKNLALQSQEYVNKLKLVESHTQQILHVIKQLTSGSASSRERTPSNNSTRSSVK